MRPLAVATLLVAAPAFAESESVSFALKNATSQAIVGLYASPASKNDWEAEVLDGETLQPGEIGRLTIEDGARTCTYDLKARFADGAELEKRAINVCELESFTYTE